MVVIFYFLEHPELALWFITMPVLGWILIENLPVKVIWGGFIISAILGVPVLCNYSYPLNNAYAILCYMMLTCLYGIALNNNLHRVKTTIRASLLLLLILGSLAFIGIYGSGYR